MKIKFSKMQGIGNDFMVLDLINQKLDLTEELVKKLANRNFGVGFDQMLIVEKSKDKDIDFIYKIFNADGSEVGQCGNGARCFAKFVYEKGLTNKKAIVAKTKTRVITLYINDDDTITVDMGEPIFDSSKIPFNLNNNQNTNHKITLDGVEFEFKAISMGNPHLVVFADKLPKNVQINDFGARLENCELFPEKANVSFLYILDKQNARLDVWERGAGRTLACGTAACASFVAAKIENLLEDDANITLAGGNLNISWQINESVIMTGKADFVFEGEIEID